MLPTQEQGYKGLPLNIKKLYEAIVAFIATTTLVVAGVTVNKLNKKRK
jgi:hypothetical protein